MIPVSATHMLSTFFFLLCSVLYCFARDTITLEDWLSSDGRTLVSAGKTFDLGFFNPNGSTEIGRFVGIWYITSRNRGDVKPRKNPNFMKNGKMVISVKIQNFSRSRMTKRTLPLESSREI